MVTSIDTQAPQAWTAASARNGTAAPRELALAEPDETADESFSVFGDDGFSFYDMIDIVNPLQHIPFVSTFYRDSFGDDIDPGSRVLGATLFFGPIGLVGALANVAVEESTGQDIGEHVVAIFDQEETPDDGPAFADAGTAATPATGDAATAPGGAPGGALGDDAVSAWARQEIAWMQGRAGALPREPASVPDAAPFLRQPDTPAPTQLADVAMLTTDARSASWAYEAAAGLGRAAQG